ncbi:hypothetical protein [Muricoccus vinaceus]|uniref:Uncharacterized protein n=1 Tax=Muricoccus vinaceus TaxID=424704 RepID=A0ABV6IVQ2_9PROT
MGVCSIAAGRTERLLQAIPQDRFANTPTLQALAATTGRNSVAGRRLIIRIAELNLDARPVVTHGKQHSAVAWSYPCPNRFRLGSEVNGNRGVVFETAVAIAGKRVKKIAAAVTTWFGWHALARWFERTGSTSQPAALAAMSEAVLSVNFIRAIAITPLVRDALLERNGHLPIVVPTASGAFLGFLRLIYIVDRFHLAADLSTFLPDNRLSLGELSAAQDIRDLASAHDVPADLLARRFMLAMEAANYDSVADRRLRRSGVATFKANAPIASVLDQVLSSFSATVSLCVAGHLGPDETAKLLEHEGAVYDATSDQRDHGLPSTPGSGTWANR